MWGLLDGYQCHRKAAALGITKIRYCESGGLGATVQEATDPGLTGQGRDTAGAPWSHRASGSSPDTKVTLVNGT